MPSVKVEISFALTAAVQQPFELFVQKAQFISIILMQIESYLMGRINLAAARRKKSEKRGK